MRKGGIEVLSDGSTTAYLDDDTPEAKRRRTEFASFKFSLIEAIAADPKKPSPYCVSIMVGFCKYANHETRQSYLSISSMMIVADIRSKTTAVRCRDWLIQHKYLCAVEQGTSPAGEILYAKGRNGEAIYKVCNPRQLDILDHIRDATDKRDEEAARRKRESRLRMSRGGPETGRTENARGSNNCTDASPENGPNTLEEPVDNILYEMEPYNTQANLSSIPVSYSDVPFAIPADENETIEAMEAIRAEFDLRPDVADYVKTSLLSGYLTEAALYRICPKKIGSAENAYLADIPSRDFGIMGGATS